MLAPKRSKSQPAGYFHITKVQSAAGELKFISELGRSLLFTVHPKKVALRVAEAVKQATGAEVCAVAAELEHIGLVSCTSASDTNEVPQDFLDKNRFKQWLNFLPPQISFLSENKKNFLIKGVAHQFEYVSPLHINGEVRGALIVGFKKKSECAKSAQRLIDAATQMAAMSINLTAHYEATLNTSIIRAKEEHRRFTEAVLDTLPISLYVI